MGTASNAINIHDLFLDVSFYQMPLFQRQYQWSVDSELPRFWTDLISVFDEEVDLAFLGAIVLQLEKEGNSKTSRIYTVIDGQQRITTFFLLLCAIVNFYKQAGYEVDGDGIESQYLVSRIASEAGKAKLIPTLRDNSSFNAVVKAVKNSAMKFLPDTSNDDGPMIIAYVYFMEKLDSLVEGLNSLEAKAKIDKFVDVLTEKIEIVQIVLDKSHNANEVFDRLNTAGRPLGIIDLVRNELFQTVSEDYSRALELYEKHWQPFEKSFEKCLSDHPSEERNKIMDGLFFPYALVHLNSSKKNNILKNLRSIWLKMSDEAGDGSANVKIDPVVVIESLNELRGPYLALDQGIRLDGVTDSTWQHVQKLRQVPIPGVTHPYLMRLLAGVVSGEVPESAAIRVFGVLEAFFVRRGFVGLEPTGLHAIFKRLWSDAGFDADLVAKKIETGTVSFPNDDEVYRAIMEKGLYKKKIEKFVLSSYEGHIQDSSIFQLSYLPKITTDHIMPQTLQGEWKEVISEVDHGEVCDLWGNLIPLSAKENSTKGAKSFSAARSILANETAFLTTKRFLMQQTEWGKAEILERTRALAKWAIAYWPKPDAKPVVDLLDL